jgi:hypothetical protein
MTPAGWTWIAGGAAVLVVDGILISRGHDSLTKAYGEAADSHWRWLLFALWGYLFLHLHAPVLGLPGWLSKFDPLAAIGRFLS